MGETSGMRRAATRLAAVAALLVLGLVPAARAAAQDDEETYESPQYGYTLTYDTDDWEVVQEDEDEDDPYDTIALSNGLSTISVIGDPDYDEDELDDCVDDYLAGLEQNENSSDIEPYDEREAEGDDGDVVWATYTYTFEFDDGDEEDFVRYFRCTALDDGLTLVVIHDAGIDDYEDEAEEREDLLEGLELPRASDDEDDDDSRTRTDEDDDDAARQDDDDEERQDDDSGDTAEIADGKWEGESDNGEAFALTIKDGGVSSVSYAYECNGQFVTSTSTVGTPVPIEDGDFELEVNIRGQSTTVVGTFADGQAEGTLTHDPGEEDGCPVELDWTVEEP